MQSVMLDLPENLYIRLQQTAQATRQSFNDVLLHAVQVGSPPSWEDAPAMFQADLAALDRLPDDALWRVARNLQDDKNLAQRYQDLLDKNANGQLSTTEREELTRLRNEADRFMLCKAYAAALLRWRGHQIPPAEKL